MGNPFIIMGFINWNGDNCAFVRRVGKDPNFLHKIVVKVCNDLMNGSQHIEKVGKHTSKQIKRNE